MSKSPSSKTYAAIACFAVHETDVTRALAGLVAPGLTVHAVTTAADLKAAAAKEPRLAFVSLPGEDPSTPPELYDAARDAGLVVIAISEHFRIAKDKADQVDASDAADDANKPEPLAPMTPAGAPASSIIDGEEAS